MDIWYFSLCQCARLIKDTLDARFGQTWHVVVGEGFGMDLSYEVASWCTMVHGAWCMVLVHHGAWCMVHGAWCWCTMV